MGSRGIRDDVAPWSFFLPVTLAVVVGGLLAGLVLRGIDAVFFSATDATEIARRPVAVQREATAGPGSAPDTRAPDAPSAAAAGPPARDAASGAASHAGSAQEAPPVLPGAIVARREGAPEACINGTIALRADNGWEQRLEHDVPVPCREASAASR